MDNATGQPPCPNTPECKLISNLQPGDIVGEESKKWYTVRSAMRHETLNTKPYLVFDIEYPDGGVEPRYFDGDIALPILKPKDDDNA